MGGFGCTAARPVLRCCPGLRRPYRSLGVRRMAEDSRPPPEPSELPRRIPGTGGLTPGQVRRGFLPARRPTSAARASPPEAARASQAEQSEPLPQGNGAPGSGLPGSGSTDNGSPGSGLPRRPPGASAIQTPPEARLWLRPPRADAPGVLGVATSATASAPASSGPEASAAPASAPETSAAPTRSWPPSPADLASSAASLLRATSAVELAAAELAAAELAAATAPRTAPAAVPPTTALTPRPRASSLSVAAAPTASPETTEPSPAATPA